jgi:Domain of unknown function (DUF4189)
MFRIALSLAVLLSLLVTASAEEYGAIAYDSDSGSWGGTFDNSSQAAANSLAIHECFLKQNALGNCQNYQYISGSLLWCPSHWAIGPRVGLRKYAANC